MRDSTRSLLAAGLLALASRASAQVASVCPSTNVCFKLNIPASTASSGSGDIFFQLSAPSSYEWVALGQGTAMSGANMFVVYTSSGDSNVTLSPRTTTGHNMPTLDTTAQAVLLEGSGVSNGIMTANVKCSNCNSWSGGTMDFTASSGNWIYGAHSSGGPKNSNDQSASISQHNENNAFSWSFANAKGGDSVNPLVNAAGSSTGSGGSTATSCIPRSASSTGASAAAASSTGASSVVSPTVTSDSQGSLTRFPYGPTFFPTARPTTRPYDDESSKRFAKRQDLPYCDAVPGGSGSSSSNSNTNAGYTPLGSEGNHQMMLIAHGVLASLAFVILFPAGAIAIRLASFPGVLWLHAAFQVFAYLVYIAAFGIGVYMANGMDLLDSYHPIIGMVVLVLVFFQPISGILHHSLFKKYRSRTLWSYVHIWLGRIAVTLGIINGGLGLKLANSMHMSSQGGIIAYGVIAALMWLAWVVAMFIGERRRKRASANAPPKYADSPRAGSDRIETAPINGHYAPKEGP